jgi:hypothetical protein
VASLEANWRGADHPCLKGTEARLQALFTEETTRTHPTFRNILVSSLGDAKSSLGDAESLLGDAKSSLGDAKSSPGGAKSSLGGR